MEKYRKTFCITSFESDSEQRLRIHSLFNLFQDVADHHADQIGVGYDFCHDKKIGWVAFAYHLKINRLPVWREEIEVETWPSGTTAVCGIRDFNVQTLKGEKLVVATSEWALIDMERLRPISIAKNLPHYDPVDERAFVSDFSKIQEPIGDYREMTFSIHRDDIDMNQHVNNALYPTWCLDCMNDDFLIENTIDELQIFFKKSAKWGMEIMIQTYQQDNQTIHVIQEKSSKTELAVVKIKWKHLSK